MTWRPCFKCGRDDWRASLRGQVEVLTCRCGRRVILGPMPRIVTRPGTYTLLEGAR